MIYNMWYDTDIYLYVAYALASASQKICGLINKPADQWLTLAEKLYIPWLEFKNKYIGVGVGRRLSVRDLTCGMWRVTSHSDVPDCGCARYSGVIYTAELTKLVCTQLQLRDRISKGCVWGEGPLSSLSYTWVVIAGWVLCSLNASWNVLIAVSVLMGRCSVFIW